eukprot:232091-Pyramimonas_sp.AAC.1
MFAAAGAGGGGAAQQCLMSCGRGACGPTRWTLIRAIVWMLRARLWMLTKGFLHPTWNMPGNVRYRPKS